MLKQRIDSGLVALLVAALPALMLTEIGQTSGVFYALIVVCLSICFSRTGGIRTTLAELRDYRGLGLALGYWVLMVLVAMLTSTGNHTAELERGLRLSLGTLVILGACLSLIPQWLRQAAWGMTIGTVAATYVGFSWTWSEIERVDNFPQYNAVSYGNLLILLATLSTLSIGWKLTPYRRTEVAIKALIGFAGLLGFMTTQTRSGWVAMPFFILIGSVLWVGSFKPRKLFLPAVVALLLAATVFTSSSTMRTRLQQGVDQLVECSSAPNTISSMCVRVQLWRASWLMFKENPLLGNGATNLFGPVLEGYVDKGIVSSFTTDEEFDEPHNDIFYMLAGHGLLGLAALLLLYFAPAWIFIRRLAEGVPQTARVAAAMGLSVCLGFFACGLTELMFRGMRTMSFYALMIGWLMALSDTRNYSR
ncbi:MAG: O-antigen ligase family protein [Betaproteobacteria bacterium]